MPSPTRLKADATPSASAGAKAGSSPSPSAPPSGGAATGANAALQAKFAALDCSDKAVRTKAGEGVKPERPDRGLR